MKTTEDNLQQIFNNFNPDLGDSTPFMDQLTKKLQALDYLQQLQRKERQRYRRIILASFLIGILCGGGLFAYMLTHPITLQFTLNIPLFNTLNTPHILTPLLASLLTITIIFTLTTLFQSLHTYRDTTHRLHPKS